ncbi:hypothetical protein QVN03_23420 [Raoultella terrigena]|uniref:hypothetical protein n=1 Tax=Raoultella terrigena TaxID=577 RepID=UPI0025B1B329|nr:hypothetical protein [Raoultella terrigena]WJV38292.1 hypothetical protein QVN03_23420 [Raoultella terrigena]
MTQQYLKTVSADEAWCIVMSLIDAEKRYQANAFIGVDAVYLTSLLFNVLVIIKLMV